MQLRFWGLRELGIERMGFPTVLRHPGAPSRRSKRASQAAGYRQPGNLDLCLQIAFDHRDVGRSEIARKILRPKAGAIQEVGIRHQRPHCLGFPR